MTLIMLIVEAPTLHYYTWAISGTWYHKIGNDFGGLLEKSGDSSVCNMAPCGNVLEDLSLRGCGLRVPDLHVAAWAF